MDDQKTLQVIVPEALKNPQEVDMWRFRVDANQNFIFDFARTENETEAVLTSSISLNNDSLNNFTQQFFRFLYKAHSENIMNVELFKDVKTPVQEKEGGMNK